MLFLMMVAMRCNMLRRMVLDGPTMSTVSTTADGLESTTLQLLLVLAPFVTDVLSTHDCSWLHPLPSTSIILSLGSLYLAASCAQALIVTPKARASGTMLSNRANSMSKGGSLLRRLLVVVAAFDVGLDGPCVGPAQHDTPPY